MPSRTRRELPVNSTSRRMERKPLFKTCRSWRLSRAGGNSDPLVPWPMPMRACCQSRMRKVSEASRKIDSCSGSSVRAQREALARRGAEHLARRHPEHAPDVHERPQRAVLQAKDGRVLAGFVDHGVLEERQRRQTRQAIVGQHVQEIAVHRADDRAPRRRATATHGREPGADRTAGGPGTSACGPGRAAISRSASATRPCSRRRGTSDRTPCRLGQVVAFGERV